MSIIYIYIYIYIFIYIHRSVIRIRSNYKYYFTIPYDNEKIISCDGIELYKNGQYFFADRSTGTIHCHLIIVSVATLTLPLQESD